MFPSLEPIMIVVKILAAIFIYNIPSMIAFSRRHPEILRIMTLNIVLGWTVIAYVAALVWSVMPISPKNPGDEHDKARENESQGGEGILNRAE